MSFKGLKKLPRFGSSKSDTPKDGESAPSAPDTPASEVPSTGSPVSTPPTSPMPDTPSEQSGKRPGLFGRTSGLVKNKVSSIPSFGASKSSGPSDEDGAGSSGLLRGTLSSAGAIAGNLASSIPSVSMPTFSLDSLPLADTLETMTGNSSLAGFGSIKDLLSGFGNKASSANTTSDTPTGEGGDTFFGIRRLERAKLKAGEVRDDVLKQAVERRKQLWKRTIVIANSLAPPDSLFRFSGRGASFVLKPQTRGIIPLQWFFRGPGTIDDRLADHPCGSDTGFSVDQLLHKLNDIAGTKYTLNEPGLGDVLQTCLDRSYDFGYAYGMLRPVWSSGKFDTLHDRWQILEEKDTAMRKHAIKGDTIIASHIPPRRVWDLYSNRVLPFWAIADVDLLRPDDYVESEFEDDDPDAAQVASEAVVTDQPAPSKEATAKETKLQRSNIPSSLWAVSHAWAHEDDRRYETTVINGGKWPVPLPNDSHLDRVRIELLNYGAVYAWLDVLCLNQNNMSEDEKLKLECLDEWKLDVPTIGHVYQHDRYQTVITYFNGLGRPFIFGSTVVKRDRHWLNRAWTLQETTLTWLPGGLTLALFDRSKYGDVVRPGLFEQVQRLYDVFAFGIPDIFDVLGAIRDRSYSSENDRVGAIGYLLKIPTVPTHKWEENVESAWMRLLYCLSDKHRTDLLVLYPMRGDSDYRWAPSWYQLMGPKPPSIDRIPYNSSLSVLTDDHDWKPKAWLSIEKDKTEYLRGLKNEDGSVTYYHHAYVIEDCNVRLTGSRDGKIIVQTQQGRAVKFEKNSKTVVEVEYDMNIEHDHPVPPGNYILIGVARLKYWVLGKLLRKLGDKEYEVEKLTVIRVHNPSRNKLLEANPGIAEAKVVYT